jgi:hypothetical protein
MIKVKQSAENGGEARPGYAGGAGRPHATGKGCGICPGGARRRSLARGAAAILYIHVSVFFAAVREKEARVLKGVFPISSLGLRGSSLRLFLVFGTPFFHLVITID